MYIRLLKISPVEDSLVVDPNSIDGTSYIRVSNPDVISSLLECVEVPALPIRDQELQFDGFDSVDPAVIFRVHQVQQHIKLVKEVSRQRLVSRREPPPHIDATVWVR